MALGLSYLAAGDGVIDVGCNSGHYLQAYADRVGKTGYVWGLEPHPTAAQTARAHTSHRPWVTVQQVALTGPSDAEDRAFSRQGVLWCGSDSKQASLAAGNCLGTPVEIPCVLTTLDAIWITVPKAPKLIKIDAQGSEAAILTGATEALDARLSIWVLEIWKPGLERLGATVEDVLRPFETRGYVPFGPDAGEYSWSHVRDQAEAQRGHSSIDIAFHPGRV
jgi:FkbM family methyltransferase